MATISIQIPDEILQALDDLVMQTGAGVRLPLSVRATHPISAPFLDTRSALC